MSSTQAASIRKVVGDSVSEEAEDRLAVEEPLEIRVGFPNGEHRAVSITMRTPCDDGELAAGFLFTEGIIRSPLEIEQIRHCGLKIGRPGDTLARAAALNSNTIRVDLSDAVDVDLERLARNFYTTSSCGVCGKSSIEALRGSLPASFPPPSSVFIDGEVIRSIPAKLRAAQQAFEQTGGLHASALFTPEGTLDLVREDVGRHNALDKVIGAKFLAAELPLTNRILLVSGRVSFELVQKSLMAGIPVLAAIGAPSSLAVELAQEFGMTIIGFVRGDSFNVYTGHERVGPADNDGSGRDKRTI